jgi:hypothetical protein
VYQHYQHVTDAAKASVLVYTHSHTKPRHNKSWISWFRRPIEASLRRMTLCGKELLDTTRTTHVAGTNLSTPEEAIGCE